MVILKDFRFWLCTVGIVILGFISGLLSGNPGSYYYSLDLPPFAPPSWIFGPMWTVLYILMGMALYFLTQMDERKLKRKLLTLFVIQFICNFLWSALFFNLQSNFIAAVDLTLSFMATFSFSDVATCSILFMGAICYLIELFYLLFELIAFIFCIKRNTRGS